MSRFRFDCYVKITFACLFLCTCSNACMLCTTFACFLLLICDTQPSSFFSTFNYWPHRSFELLYSCSPLLMDLDSGIKLSPWSWINNGSRLVTGFSCVCGWVSGCSVMSGTLLKWNIILLNLCILVPFMFLGGCFSLATCLGKKELVRMIIIMCIRVWHKPVPPPPPPPPPHLGLIFDIYFHAVLPCPGTTYMVDWVPTIK